MAIDPKILTEISSVTRDIEENYPELQKYLGENPMTLPDENEPDVDNKAFKDYLESLKTMVAEYKENEPN